MSKLILLSSAAVVAVDGKPVKLQLCDTAGQVSAISPLSTSRPKQTTSHKHTRQCKFIKSLYKDDILFAQTHAGRSPGLLTVNRPMSYVLISHTGACLYDKRESDSVLFCLLMIRVSGKVQLKFAVKEL